MISGLNQEVNVLGRAFHFQTELARRGDFFIRTEVFVGGKIVATRESRCYRAGRKILDEESLQALMKEHHSRVIESTLERVKSYQERREAGLSAARPAPTPSAPAPGLPPFDAEQARNLVPPSDEVRVSAASAVRIRRIFGKFRLRLDLVSAVPESELEERLETAARGFAWIMGSPTFQEFRLDEQMRCHLVNDRLKEWLASDRDGARAAEMWSEIVTFNVHVAEINNRAELFAFDRQLVTWAAYQIKSQGMSNEILDQLQWLSGRDPELDKLLDRPDGVADDTWFSLLCQMLAQIPASGAA